MCPDSRNVNEDELLEAYLRALNKVAGSMDDYLMMIRESCTMVLTPKKKRELADIEQAIIDVQEAVLELHKQKKNGLLTPIRSCASTSRSWMNCRNGRRYFTNSRATRWR